MSFEKGTKIHVRITATVGDKAVPYLSACTEVRETEEIWQHFLFLGSRKITGNKSLGSIITADFDAQVTGEYKAGRRVTTQVIEIEPNGRAGFTHYLYLDSKSITVTTLPGNEPKPEPEPNGTFDGKEEFKIGTRIRVDITGKVGAKGGPSSTNSVQELSGGQWSHFLYVDTTEGIVLTEDVPNTIRGGSPFVTGTRDEGGIIRAVFDAQVTGEFGKSPLVTTQVREINPDAFAYTHYLYLNSSAVTRVTDEPVTDKPEPISSFITTPPRRERSNNVNISEYQTTIDSDDLEARIAELTSTQFEVVRTRDGNVLASFDERDEATQYIDEEDLNPARFTVREEELNEDDTEELRELRVLEDVTDGLSAPWTLYNDDFFDSEWAEDQIIEELGVSRSAMGDWPLNLIDLSDAATERRNDRYTIEVEFRGTTFYAEDE